MKSLSILLLVLLFAVPAVADTPTDGGEEDFIERMAKEHAGERPVPSPMVLEGSVGVDLETIEVEYAILDGTPVQGYLARPASGEIQGAVIVIHEWWGLNDNIRVMAERLAAEGWAALAVDLYEGATADKSDEARKLAMALSENRERGASNLKQAREWLTNELGVERVGVIGWCLGGGWSLQTALMLGDQIDAAVIYYGRVASDPAELEPLTAPVMGHFGAEDNGIPLDGVKKFEQALSDLGKTADVFIYDGAHHAFANPSGSRFKADAAAEAWQRTLQFFHQHLDG